MLTGDPKALETCRRNADGLKAGWQSVAESKPYGGPQGNMAAVGWSILSFTTMYDITADKKWLDEALGLFRAYVIPTWQAAGPHLHNAMDQIRSQDYVEEDYAYCCAIQALCELHHHTNDEKLMELLKAGADKELPTSTFFEAPVYVSGLQAYVAVKLKSPDYLAKAVEMFAQAFPESKSPPVFLANNSTWSRDASMMLRTGHLLQYACWKMKARP